MSGYSRLCEKQLKRSSSDVGWAMLGASRRKIRMAGTVSGVAIEPQPDEQGGVAGGVTKWRHVFVNHKPKSPTVVCSHERELWIGTRSFHYHG